LTRERKTERAQIERKKMMEKKKRERKTERPRRWYGMLTFWMIGTFITSEGESLDIL